jgi:uncharacterized repeat protein (TIGR03803 family)
LAAVPAAAKEITLYTLGQNAGDGSLPNTGLSADAEGNLFGATVYGGAPGSGGKPSANDGVVYEVSPSGKAPGAWTEKVIHSFAGGADGKNPNGPITLDPFGNAYGVTGDGTVYELKRPTAGGWPKTILHTFVFGANQGLNPVGALLRDRAGNLYGVTFLGGGVYRLSPNSKSPGTYTFTLLYTFDAFKEGGAPQAGLVMDVSGNLYGTTSQSVFRLNRPASSTGAWTLTELHAFGGKNDGTSPGALMIDTAGNLYGTAFWGGAVGNGVAFEVSVPTRAGGPWGYRVIHQFVGGKYDGAHPTGGALVADSEGNLYGNTGFGGLHSFGAVYKLKRPATASGTWSPSLVYSFTGGTDGASPVGGLRIDGKGDLFGVAFSGQVFEITP